MQSSRIFRWTIAIVGLALISTFVLMTRSNLEPRRANLGPGPIAGSHYVARGGGFSEQQLPCSGQAVPTKLVKLDSLKVIDVVTICSDYPSRHDFQLERSALTASVIDQLAMTLALPDEPRDYTLMCTMEYPTVSSVVIRLHSGVTLRPSVPINVCRKPLNEVMAAISAIESFQFPQD